MAKKVSTAKDKKAARKAETERLQQLKKQLMLLNEADNLLADFPAFASYNRQGLAAKLHFYKAEQLSPTLCEWAFSLTKRHMQALYDASPGWGWSDAKKRAELADPAARFIVATQQPATAAQAPACCVSSGMPIVPEPLRQQQQQGGQPNPEQQQQHPLGFLHFRFEEEEGEPVAYLYEIQIDGPAQGKGLGAFLMCLLELLAWKAGMARVMLTVFQGNAAALHLYRKLGYVLDESSPELHDPEGTYTYQIMSKRRKQPVQAVS